jgi:ribonuclease D
MNSFDPGSLLQTSHLIETPADLERFLPELRRAEAIAVDTESAAFYKYHHVVNLIQISTDRAAAIIDPQALKDLSPLKTLAAESEAVWIMHGSGYDLRVLKRDFGIEFPRLFDTRTAAELLGMPELGLSSLCGLFLGFSLNKKLQRCDWSRRPLTAGMREYGLLDAICLIPVFQHLQDKLRQTDRESWQTEECQHILESLRHDPPPLPEENSFQFLIKGSRDLSHRALCVLKEIWTFRDGLARQMDRAPFMLLHNQTLLDLARKAPQTMAGLAALKGIPGSFLDRYGRGLLDAVKAGLQAPLLADLPLRDPHPQNFLSSWEGEIAKLLRENRNQHAERLHLPAAVLCCSDAINALAHDRPADADHLLNHGSLRRWQAQILCEDFLHILQSPPPTYTPKRSRRRRRSR